MFYSRRHFSMVIQLWQRGQ